MFLRRHNSKCSQNNGFTLQVSEDEHNVSVWEGRKKGEREGRREGGKERERSIMFDRCKCSDIPEVPVPG